MNWFTWQQHKKQFLIFGILLAGFAALAIPTGLHFQQVYQDAKVACASANTCDQLRHDLFQVGFDSDILLLMKAILVAVPVLLGIFWGVSLIAREYNEGTNLLVWTRSVSRRKWLTIKLAWILAATVIVSGAFAALSTWWWGTGNALYLDRFDPLNFGVQGIVPVAYAVFAVAVGIAFGAWLKRVVFALALTLGVLIVVQIIVPTMVRPHYMPPQLYTAPMSVGGPGASDLDEPPTPPNAGAALTVSGKLVSKQGQTLSWTNPPERCAFTREQIESSAKKVGGTGKREADSFIRRADGPAVSIRCLIDEGYTWQVKYQPSSRYWNFQRIETALYLGLAAIPLTATYWLVLRRDA